MKEDAINLAERIAEEAAQLPPGRQVEVLDFIQFLKTKTLLESGELTDTEWSAFSLACALRGMEDEPDLYTLDDLKERWQ